MEKTITLPGGFLDSEGLIHKEVTIVPMTGKVRRQIGDQNIRKRAYSILNTILGACIKSIGSIEKINQKLLGEMLSGDRGYCLMEIRRFRGDSVKAEEQCSRCNETSLYEVSLDSFEINKLEDGDYRIEDIKGRPTMVFDFDESGVEFDCAFRFRSGEDDRVIEPLFVRNPLDAQFEMWRRCLISWARNGTDAKPPWSHQFFDDLYEDEIEAIDEAFTRIQPGPERFVEDFCPCGAEVQVSLANSDFLLPVPAIMKRKSFRSSSR